MFVTLLGYGTKTIPKILETQTIPKMLEIWLTLTFRNSVAND